MGQLPPPPPSEASTPTSGSPAEPSSSPPPSQLPLWLQIDPRWQQEIEDFNTRNGTDIVASLQTFGMRWNKDMDPYYTSRGLVYVVCDVYVEDQPEAEEGWAQEHLVRSLNPDEMVSHGDQLLNRANTIISFHDSCLEER